MAVTFSFGHKLLEAADLRRRHARATALPPSFPKSLSFPPLSSSVILAGKVA